MSEAILVGIIFIVLGLTAGVGMLMVKPSLNEPDAISKVFPGASLFKHKTARILMAVLGFCFAAVGLNIILNGAL